MSSTALFFLHALLLMAVSLGVTPVCNTSCGGMDIPYPFGVGSGCFRKGFEIDCDNNNGPVLAGTTLQVVHLSLDPDESQVMLPIGWQCYNTTNPRDTFAWSYGETKMNKDGVYRISNTHNMLVVVGCNSMGMTVSERTEGGTESYAYFTGCMSYCNNSASAKDKLCEGVGCCHVNIPPGLTDSYFNFREYDHSAMLDYSPCDYAFLVGKNNHTFQRSDLLMDKNRTSPVWLDWAIRDNGSGAAILSCANATTTACVSAHSDCVDSRNGPGYNCKCSKGYQGNAYVVNGCNNIDECADNAKYPCYCVCDDTQGSYKCTCRPGYRSTDPRTQRCSPKFPLAAQISIGAIGGVLVLAFLSFSFVIHKERRKTSEFYKKNGGPILEEAKNIKIFKVEDLKPILKDSNLVGKGGFGEVYKGVLNKEQVAIKKPISGKVLEDKNAADGGSNSKNQFANEVIIQSRVIHKNIVRLIGCCLEVDTPMLVYEFVSKGRPILHGDVKPANILLDDNLMPKISDFGISRLIPRDKTHTMLVIGDLTYMDPVYLQEGRLTEKSDVYSFGIVILELISRKKATHTDNNILVKSFLDQHKNGKKATDLFDKEIAIPEDLELLDSLAEIAVECLNLDVDKRPWMKDVAQRLFILNPSHRS